MSLTVPFLASARVPKLFSLPEFLLATFLLRPECVTNLRLGKPLAAESYVTRSSIRPGFVSYPAAGSAHSETLALEARPIWRDSQDTEKAMWSLKWSAAGVK